MGLKDDYDKFLSRGRPWKNFLRALYWLGTSIDRSWSPSITLGEIKFNSPSFRMESMSSSG